MTREQQFGRLEQAGCASLEFTSARLAPRFMFELPIDGDDALFPCEGTVFEVVSPGRRWPGMVPFASDMAVATSLPLEGMIVRDGLIVRHHRRAADPGVERLQREPEEARRRGIAGSPGEFAPALRGIKRLRRERGLDPASCAICDDAVNRVDAMTSDTCFPYAHRERMRPVSHVA